MGKVEDNLHFNPTPLYRERVNPVLMDTLMDGILQIIVTKKKYKDKYYTARKLASDLGTNTRYVSAVLNARFHMNYTSFVNKYRVEDAMFVLVDKRYQELNIDEISDMVGFSNRQSFYSAFQKQVGITPKRYRVLHSNQQWLQKKKS